MSMVDAVVAKKVRIGGAADINRFYYRKTSCASKRSSLSLDSVLVELLMVKFGAMPKLRKWVSAQAKIAQESGLDAKSISRAVQENAIRVIADPSLVGQLPLEQRAEAERQGMQWSYLGQSAAAQGAGKSKRL